MRARLDDYARDSGNASNNSNVCPRHGCQARATWFSRIGVATHFWCRNMVGLHGVVTHCWCHDIEVAGRAILVS